jgi:replicative DNA helicase
MGLDTSGLNAFSDAVLGPPLSASALPELPPIGLDELPPASQPYSSDLQANTPSEFHVSQLEIPDHLTQAVSMNTPFERIPPQSLEAEQAVLGAMLVEPNVLMDILEIIQPKHFYRPAHQKIYDAVLNLYNQTEPVDIITVSEALNDKGLLESVGGRSYISDLALSIITTENARYYATLIRNKALLRELITVGSEIVTTAYEEDDAETAIDQAQQAVFAVAQQGLKDALTHIKDVLPISFEQIEERHTNKGSLMGVPSGFYDLDNYTSGFQPSDLIILAARPSMGKTALTLNFASNVALKANQSVLVFSLEMSKEACVLRMLCAEAEIDAQRIRTGELNEQDFARLSMAMGRLGDAPLYIDDTPGLSVMEMRAKARKLMMETGQGIGLIIIDYLQLMEAKLGSKSGGENRQQEVASISRGLKSLARELKAPVMALSQLSRGVESRTDKRPMLSDLRESGSIEQDADLVMFIYRDEYYNPETDRPGIADIIIAKQRNGPVGNVSLIFRNNITKFINPVENNNIRVF